MIDEKEQIVCKNMSGYINSEIDEKLRDIITLNPQVLFEKSVQDFKREKRSRVSLISFSGKPYIVKHYFVKNFLFRIRRFILPSLALNIRDRVKIMEQHHISTPVLLAAVDIGKRFSYKGTTCLYEYVKPDKDKDQLREDFQEPEKRDIIISAVASLLGRMHHSGIYHGDAKISNFLWIERSGEADIHVIDLDDCRFMGKVTANKRLADLANLVFSFAWWNSTPDLPADCFGVYLQHDASWCSDEKAFLDELKKKVARKLEHRRSRQKKK
ncbi:MAG: hypothetical protein BM485_07835 [Desulfobulbaceae bacterium DB1]|nr:MAG: hypothetical protein BM485_07835 [Desulfobulbaceae bacterium DB1]